MSEDIVYYEDLGRAKVLAALYNNSQPMGMGFLQAMHGPQEMDEAYAVGLINAGGQDASTDYPVGIGRPLYFDYLYGRPLKVDLTNGEFFDPRLYDRDNGGDGTAAAIVARLR